MLLDEQELRQQLAAAADQAGAPHVTAAAVTSRIRRRRTAILGLVSGGALHGTGGRRLACIRSWRTPGSRSPLDRTRSGSRGPCPLSFPVGRPGCWPLAGRPTRTTPALGNPSPSSSHRALSGQVRTRTASPAATRRRTLARGQPARERRRPPRRPLRAGRASGQAELAVLDLVGELAPVAGCDG